MRKKVRIYFDPNEPVADFNNVESIAKKIGLPVKEINSKSLNEFEFDWKKRNKSKVSRAIEFLNSGKIKNIEIVPEEDHHSSSDNRDQRQA
ncbi:MAG: hypothetical protein OEY51_10810, partial [Cyclobacteriaceae bacterium]|nr:hypothetical protein [Cyclobacteriaceae bacterium]